MSSYDDQVRNWQSTMDGHRSEYDTLVEETRKLGDRMKAQSARYVTTAGEIFNGREVLMDTAYEMLVKFVVEDLLKYADGQDEIGTGGVPALPVVVQRFKALTEYCEKVIDDENIEAVESTQEIGEGGQIIQRIKSLKERLQTDIQGLGQTVERANSNFDVDHAHHMDACEALRNAEEKAGGFFYVLFGDGNIDNAIHTCRSNEQNWRSQADAAWNFWDQLRRIRDSFQYLSNCDLDSLMRNLGDLADEMRVNYKTIIDTRQTDNGCWVSTRTLQYHVTTNTEYTSRDDALRHVLKLLHTVNKTIDDDKHVEAFKEGIETAVREKLGTEKAEELHQEKRFLAKPEDLDF
ncbi:Fc.00g079860.m01.CDS01 [Cosmosporella sp. VM-42]